MRPLDIVVCLKSVPDPRQVAAVSFDPRTLVMNKKGVRRVISPLDKNALEEALRLRERFGGTVRVLSMGSPSAADNLREALAIGADEVLFLSDAACAGADTLATARALAALVRYAGHFDLILCGARSFYGSTGQVGPQLGEFLDVGHISHVAEIEFAGDDAVSVKSRLEDGYALVEGKLPLVLSVTKEINSPRGISFLGIVAARSKPLRTVSIDELGLTAAEVGLSGSATRMIRVFSPTAARRGTIIGGTPRDAVPALVAELRKAGTLPMLGTSSGGDR